MTKRKWLFLGLIIYAILLLFMSGCIEAEADLLINHDGSGKLIVIASATDSLFNEMIDELIMSTRSEEPAAKIKEGYKNNLKYAEIEIPFQDVAELAKQNLYVSHHHDNQKHRIDIETNELLLGKITLQMPGKITASNGSFSGSKVYWDQAGTMGLMWAESESSSIKSPLVYILILVVLLLVALIGWQLLSRNIPAKTKIASGVGQSRYCNRCRYSFSYPEEAQSRFCPNCGAPQIGTTTSQQDDEIDIELF